MVAQAFDQRSILEKALHILDGHGNAFSKMSYLGS